MLTLESWSVVTERVRLVVALEAASVDRKFIFEFFLSSAQQREISCYYWNLGYDSFQQIRENPSENYQLCNTELILPNRDVLQFLLSQNNPGIFLIDDWVNFEEINPLERRRRESQIQNLIERLRIAEATCYVILLGTFIQFSEKLSAEVPVLKYPLPDAFAVQSMVNNFCSERGLELERAESLQRLVVACQGLPKGEIDLALNTHSALANNVEQLAELILNYKVAQLRGLGLEFIAEPDVPSAGGLDLLQRFLYEKVVKLNEPSARKYNLRPPRGMLLLGPPGTGKTLSAKLAAKALGYSLLALSWGNVLGSDNPDKTLAKILEIADCLDRCILLGDDFDKGFTGWESGGVSRRLSQRLLTWMQEHTSHVMMIATVNRIKLLPSEIKRRFDDGGIWFVDLPDMGSMYEIFRIHLGKYFPTQFGEGKDPWTDREWYGLLKKYRGATPVEIGNAVARCAQDFYCSLSQQEREKAEVPATITVKALEAQLEQFEMASKRDAEDLQAIRNSAYYARPASSPDRSRFAIAKQDLFEYQPHQFDAIEN
jgi:hypothetical protein